MTPEEEQALRTARALLDLGHPLETVLTNSLIPEDLREFVRDELQRDENFQLAPPRLLTADPNRPDWVQGCDRSSWHYWPTLRQFLLTTRGWNMPSVRSLDDASDRILRQLAEPTTESFDIRGLVLGFVQSGKTANYTALIAKAADAGYRLVIVLSGIDNGLRRQTNGRLKRELVGYTDSRMGAVRLPPLGQQWHEFTRDDFDGDFRPGFANHAALQGSQPVLLVVKKNGHVLRRLLSWLDEAPIEVRRNLPFLLIDDEADLASVDTRGSYQSEEDPPDEDDQDYEPPSVINALIRNLLQRFERRAYVAYTATPFANILIPHDTADPRVGNDLYPRDFILDLPKPNGYFGAEEFFGRMDAAAGEEVGGGIDVVRHVPDEDLAALEHGQLPESLHTAVLDFVLAGAARAQRGRGDAPASMLIHTSRLIINQAPLHRLVNQSFAEMRDDWRYQRNHGIRDRLRERWEADFRPVTRNCRPERDVDFETLDPFVGPFLEAVQVREINSATGDVLDYEREPSLKAIAIGGNRLSRGLTLEGLVVSYFVRRSATYDTLMQMGRWFGFRDGYEDLIRIFTTAELESWFSDLAFVEHRLREDIQIYEDQGLTPHQLGMRIWQHPAMQVTAPLKRRFASSTTIAQSYSLALEQTFKFPLRRLEDLAVHAEANLIAVRDLAGRLGAPDEAFTTPGGPVWTGVAPDRVLEFLRAYRLDAESRSISIPLICAYIERLVDAGELVRWTVKVCGRETRAARLGEVDWRLPDGPVSQISRSRLGYNDSLGVITSPADEKAGLSEELLDRARAAIQAAEAAGRTKSENRAAREVRPATDGLIMLYPISRHSGYDREPGANRRPLYDDADAPLARDLVGLGRLVPTIGAATGGRGVSRRHRRMEAGRLTRVSDEVWSRLAEGRAQGDLLCARRAAPDITDRLLAALDAENRRHLLIPLEPDDHDLHDDRSRGLRVATRELAIPGQAAGLYIDIVCDDGAGHEAFQIIGGEVADRLARGEEPAACVVRVLAKWRRFWGQLPRRMLSRQEQLGLFAELRFLIVWMLPRVGAANAVDRWRGPLGARHDFEWAGRSVEVKATTSTRGAVHRINGVDQLVPPKDGTLLLLSLQLREEGGGTETLPRVLTACREALNDDDEALSAFESRLAQLGYSPAHEDEYGRLLLRIVAEMLFEVRDDFPRLSPSCFPAGVPGGVERIDYEINLSGFERLCVARNPDDDFTL